VPETGAVVSHDIDGTRDVVQLRVEPVVPLVETAEGKKMGSRTSGGCGALVAPGDCRDVVIEDGKGAVCTLQLGDQDVLMGNGASQFQVRVGYVPGGV